MQIIKSIKRENDFNSDVPHGHNPQVKATEEEEEDLLFNKIKYPVVICFLHFSHIFILLDQINTK